MFCKSFSNLANKWIVVVAVAVVVIAHLTKRTLGENSESQY